MQTSFDASCLAIFDAVGVAGGGFKSQTAAAVPPTVGTWTSGTIPYSSLHIVAPGDSEAVIVEKAAKVLPRPNQTAWMRLERTFFIHFGPNTFGGVEWGSGQEDPSLFNPTAFDADQWIGAVKEAGGRQVVLVCKHHDGLCLWPSRYTKHSVLSSPWENGKGDVVGAVARAAHKYGIRLGVYLSPADLYQLRTNPKNPAGYYGNESQKVRSVIPTDPSGFKTNPARGRTTKAGAQSFTYEVDDYNRYFLNQLYELLTEFGPIHDVWFDGANPDPSVHETYDYAAWYDLIRKLQPEAVITVKGPDVRWVGNEGGMGRTTEWSIIPLPTAPEKYDWRDMQNGDLGSRARLVPGSHLWWYPAETNTTILNGWFWSAEKYPRSASELIDVYYQSVGRNSNMLLNLSPDDRGLVPDDQLAPLRQMTQVVDQTFARDMAAGGTLTADSAAPEHSPIHALDRNLDSWWEAAAGQTTPTLTLKLPRSVTFDVVSLQEAVDHRSQRIESFGIDVWDGSSWTQVEQQTTVGYKRLLRLSAPASTDQVRIRITSSRLEPTLSTIGLFKQALLAPAPIISERDNNGSVTLSGPTDLRIVYTTDGTMPTPRSAAYLSPIALPEGGTIAAAALTADGKVGTIASKRFSGFAPSGWKVIAVDGKDSGTVDSALNAIDGNPATLWVAESASTPHSLTVDMGRVCQIGGLSYLPRQDKSREGVIESYRFETSVDGNSWTATIPEGRFGNIRNNPTLQEVIFAPVNVRFFRFTSLKDVEGSTAVSIAAISVLPVTEPR